MFCIYHHHVITTISFFKILNDIIPLISFTEISRADFYNKIKPYKKVFNKEVYEEFLQYYIFDTWQPRFLLQKGPRKRKGKLLNLQMKSLISNWINEKNENDFYNENNFPYDFELIFQGTFQSIIS